ncbi:MAG: selenium cofactor biosynthesis protein YqeC [Acidimicrobiia bacterium]|nr:selenium cofactor biosynthesis protein YqeC [Acidimicrobiia bacterium]
MTAFSALLGLDERELISLVGGGGKSTVLFGLGSELAAAGRRVILTTTTKMGREQAMLARTICWSADTRSANEALDKPGPVMLLTAGDDHKVTGPAPEVVDRLFREAGADFVIVEADGSWQRPLKAPAAHEPVVPSTTTTVLILMGAGAVGRPLNEVTHRVEEAVRFTSLPPDHILTVEDCARILVHPDGALRVCPPQSRVLVAVSRIRTTEHVASAKRLSQLLEAEPRVSGCVQVPDYS